MIDNQIPRYRGYCDNPFDLKKAFDTIDHRILLRKLYSYGIWGSTLKWMESYLTDRTLYVVFDGKVSETRSIKCGVPQGCILVPLLFIISVNHICNVSPMLLKYYVPTMLVY